VSISVGASPYDVSVADINQDSFVDIIVTNNGANTISILLNKGDRTFFNQLQVPAGTNPLGIWVAGKS
jgi:DNA-binding beta-propeller fold protein YncE